MAEIQSQYNALLARIKKGEVYLGKADITEEKRSRALIRYKELLDAISDVTGKLLDALGRDLTPQELLNGFADFKIAERA